MYFDDLEVSQRVSGYCAKYISAKNPNRRKYICYTKTRSIRTRIRDQYGELYILRSTRYVNDCRNCGRKKPYSSNFLIYQEMYDQDDFIYGVD